MFSSLFFLVLCSCYYPPFNNFHPYNRSNYDGTNQNFSSYNAGAPLPGRGIYKGNKNDIIGELARYDIQYIKHGDTSTIILPTDRYYLFNSPRLNELCFKGLAYVVKLIHYNPNSMVYVAGFTDNIGSRRHKNKLTQARAETMLTFLWANGIKSAQLSAEGYGDKYAVSDNQIIHGSAQNRRIEIQWVEEPAPAVSRARFWGKMK